MTREATSPAARLVDRLAQRYSSQLPPGRTAVECAAEVLDVVRRTWDLRRTRWLLGPAAGHLAAPTDLVQQIDWQGTLSDAERGFIAAIDGSREIDTLVHECQLDPLHATQIICALALVGAVVFPEPLEAEAVGELPSGVTCRPPGPEVLDDPFPRGDSRGDENLLDLLYSA